MKSISVSIAALACLTISLAAQVQPNASSPSVKMPAAAPSGQRQATIDLGAPSAIASMGRKASFAQMPLSFEPNVGQSESAARFTARTPVYTLQLEATRAQLRLGGAKDNVDSKTVTMEMMGANLAPEVRGEEQLLGKDSYFPTTDRRPGSLTFRLTRESSTRASIQASMPRFTAMPTVLNMTLCCSRRPTPARSG